MYVETVVSGVVRRRETRPSSYSAYNLLTYAASHQMEKCQPKNPILFAYNRIVEDFRLYTFSMAVRTHNRTAQQQSIHHTIWNMDRVIVIEWQFVECCRRDESSEHSNAWSQTDEQLDFIRPPFQQQQQRRRRPRSHKRNSKFKHVCEQERHGRHNRHS